MIRAPLIPDAGRFAASRALGLEILLGGAAAWPLAARAQQGERVRRIGVLMPRAANEVLIAFFDPDQSRPIHKMR